MQAALYLDESGQFTASAAGVTGLRIVGGLLLTGGQAEHEAALLPALEEARSWFPPPVHAVDLASVPRLAFLLRRLGPQQTPDCLRSACGSLKKLRAADIGSLRAIEPSLYEEIDKESRRLLSQLRRVVGSATTRFNGAVVLCAEHDLDLAASRYDSMVVAATEGALRWWTKERGDGLVSVLLEAGSAGHAPNGLPEVLQLTGRLGTARTHGSPQAVPKNVGLVGLQLADLIVHALGPGGRQNVPWRPRWCASWDLRSLESRAHNALGLKAPLVVVDGLRGLDLLRGVQRDRLSATTAREQLDHHARRLPRGVLAASMQWQADFLEEDTQ